MVDIDEQGQVVPMEDKISFTETGVQVLDRAFAILSVISTERAPLSVVEIAKRMGLNRSTVYRLLEAMNTHGYVERDQNGKYHLGNKLVSLAGNYINSLELVTIAQPYLWDLSLHLNLSSYMAILNGMEVVYVARADSFRRNSVYSEIGWRAPAYATAHGLCLLSQYSAESLESIMKKIKFEKLTEKTINDPHALKQTLKEVRKCGYSIDDQGFENDVRCIGAPVFNYCGEIIASISVAGSCLQLPEAEWEHIAGEVVKVARKISEKMGYCQ